MRYKNKIIVILAICGLIAVLTFSIIKIRNAKLDITEGKNEPIESYVARDFVEVSAYDNKGNEEVISLDKEEFLRLMQKDIDTINNVCSAENASIKSFIIYTWYDISSNKHSTINYIVNLSYKTGENGYMALLRLTGSEDSELITYWLADEEFSYAIISQESLQEITNLISYLSQYNFTDSEREIIISGGMNSNIYSELSHNYVRDTAPPRVDDTNLTNEINDTDVTNTNINNNYNNERIEESKNHIDTLNNNAEEEIETQVDDQADRYKTSNDIKINFTNFVYNPTSGEVIALDIDTRRENDFASTTKGVTVTVNEKNAPSVGGYFEYKVSEGEETFHIVVTDSETGKVIEKTVSL